MLHHQYNEDFKFYKNPESFNKYTQRSILQYCLGATLYMPGHKLFVEAILEKKYKGLTSMALCFEDACREEDVEMAEETAIKLLDELSINLENGTFDYDDMPLLIFRVRNLEQYKSFTNRILKRHVKFICGFNFPKFNSTNGLEYFSHLKDLNEKFGEIIYGMPILEDKAIAFKESRLNELLEIKKIVDKYKRYVLNIRVGGTDFSACFGARRGINHSIYDILTVRDCLLDILNIFSRENDYTISGPVWEYFRANKSMRFVNIPDFDFHSSLIKREAIVNDAVDGLLRELILDKANGFIGKTVVHPTHLNYVNGMLAVTKEEYLDATQILGTSGGVIKSLDNNKMNEVGPHRLWADKILARAKVYGVIEDESSYIELFGKEENR